MVTEYFIPIVTVASSIAILYSTYKLNKDLTKNLREYSLGPKIPDKRFYTTRVKELEYRREMIRNAILNVIREYEKGNIDEATKEALLSRFREELDKIDGEINSIKKYAELEELEREYEKLIKEFEEKKSSLERRIAELKSSLKVKEKKPEKKESEVKEEKGKEKGKREGEEYSLEELMEEISKIMKEFGEE